MTRQKPGAENADLNRNSSSVPKTNPVSVENTMDRIYDMMVTTRKNFLATQNVGKGGQTASESKQKMKDKRAVT